jgi:hypothetical protein
MAGTGGPRLQVEAETLRRFNFIGPARSFLTLPSQSVAARRSRLFPWPVTFEWEGRYSTSYALRVIGPQGVVWEQKDVRRSGIEYPAQAAPLVAGVRYTWEIHGPGLPATRRLRATLGC